MHFNVGTAFCTLHATSRPVCLGTAIGTTDGSALEQAVNHLASLARVTLRFHRGHWDLLGKI